jgi:hypothetical protein
LRSNYFVLTDARALALHTQPFAAHVLANAVALALNTICPSSVVLTNAFSAAVFTASPLAPVLANDSPPTFFTRAPLALVLTDVFSATVFASATLTIMLAQPPTSALFTTRPYPVVLADTLAAALFTLGPPFFVHTHAASTTFGANSLQPTVHAALFRLAHFCGLVFCNKIVVLPFLVFVVQPRENKRLPRWVCHGSVVVNSKRVPVAKLCLCSCNAHAKYLLG